MKRILLITENLGSGGAERQICGLAVMLTKLGYTCRLITYFDNQFYESYLRENGVDYELVTSLSKKWTRVIRLASYVRRYKPDVVISYLSSVNLAMCLAKPLYRAKLIVSERNNNVRITYKDRIVYNAYRLADAIVPNSHSQGDFIRSNFAFLSKRIYPIINFVDTERFRPSLTPKESRPLRVLTVARYTYQKNVMRFLDVVRKVKDSNLNIHFDWFGSKDYDPEYFSQLEEKYNHLGIDDYLTLHSSCENIEEQYRNSDALCLPSLYEGYPNVVAEAMASGLPVLCSNRYENPLIIEDDRGGFLFDPENVNDIYSTIEKVYNLSQERLYEMGQYNRCKALEKNSKESFVNSYIKLIEQL